MCLGAAEAGRPESAERVGFVNDQIRAVGAAHVHDLAKRRHVAANGVEPFDHDQPVALPGWQALEFLAQALRRIVAKRDDLRRRLARRIVDARVAVAVNQDDVFGAAQTADDRQIGLVPGAENERVPLVEPVGQFALEILVDGQRAVRRPRSGRPGAVLQDGVARRGHDGRFEREAEIVVGSEHQRRPPLDDDFAGAEHSFDHRRAGVGGAGREHRAPLFDGFEFVE